jgi:hypothetical protein
MDIQEKEYFSWGVWVIFQGATLSFLELKGRGKYPKVGAKAIEELRILLLCAFAGAVVGG